MNDPQVYGALNQPSVGFFTMLLIGFLAGFIAEKVTDSDHGIIMNIVIGVVGAFLGGLLASLFNIPIYGFLRTFIAATLGAILLLWIVRRMRGRTA